MKQESDVIDSFFGEYRFLSNFYEVDIMLDGILFPSSENAYQAYKCIDQSLYTKFVHPVSPAQSKKMGLKVDIRPDWDNIKLFVMEYILSHKFDLTLNPELALKLENTGDRKLIEGNYWGDTYWGFCNGIGENNLGKILMYIRKRNRVIKSLSKW